jgi:ABC-type lipoprotein release transport system permease subunit
MAIPLVYNVRNVMQRPISTLATALGVAFVVAILVGAFALAAGFQAALVETGSPSNVIVLRTGADSELSSGISRDAANVIRALPDIAQDAQGRPLVTTEMMVLVSRPRLGMRGESNVTVRGIDPSGFALRRQVKVVSGRMFAPGSDEVIVGRRIAKRVAGCGVGERLRFGQRQFTVVGHFDAGGSAFESEIWGDVTVLGPALGRDNVFQSVTFTLRDPKRFPQVKRLLETDPRLGVEARTERQWYTEQSQLLAVVIRSAGVVITIIMAVGAIFGAMNTMYAAVGSRTREIATLLTLGFSPLAVLLAFIVESLILCLVGGAIGCLITLPINGITTSTTNWSSFSEVAFAFRVTPSGMGVGMLFAAVMGVVGGFLPALRAARQPIAATLRGE